MASSGAGSQTFFCFQSAQAENCIPMQLGFKLRGDFAFDTIKFSKVLEDQA